MTRRNLLAGGLMLSVLALSHWQQATASNYLGQFCLVLTTETVLDGVPVEIQEGVLKVGLDHIGNDHITVAGTLERTRGEAYPVGGNVELIGNAWRMSLLSTWKQHHDIYHLRIEPHTLMGEFWRMGQNYHINSQVSESI